MNVPGPTLSRRRLFALAAAGAAAVTVSPALAACTTTGTGSDGPDPLIALARRARADTAVIAAAIAADPGLAERLAPLRSARTDHAAALDREIQRLDPQARASSTAPPAAPPAADLPAVRTAIEDAAREAQGLVGGIGVERVGLVAAITACCTTYAAVLT